MKMFMIAAMVLFASVCAKAEEVRMMSLDKISGPLFLIFQTASVEAARRNLSVAQYDIEVIVLNGQYVVMFLDPDAPPTQVGSRPERPQLAVYMDNTKLKVVKSLFQR
jgi:hypothetical protein